MGNHDSLPDRFAAPARTVPLDAPLGPLSTIRALWRNPIETWTKAHFEVPISIGHGVLGKVAVVSHPEAIRRVLVDNAPNYRKDALQKRLLGPGLRHGLLEAEGDDWRVQRRTLAPLFKPKIVACFAPVSCGALLVVISDGSTSGPRISSTCAVAVLPKLPYNRSASPSCPQRRMSYPSSPPF